MATIIKARGGERIVVDHQSIELIARMNAQLDAIAAEVDDEHTLEVSA